MLKDALREFAKQTAGLAFPSSNSGTIALPINPDPANVSVYVAPCDGWLSIYASGTEIFTELYNAQAIGTFSSLQSQYARSFTLCTKGDRVYYRIYRSSLTQSFVYFIPARNS